jgi:hypothetical protein
MENSILIGISIGTFVFLLQKTDFVIEYLNLALHYIELTGLDLTKFKKRILILQYENLEEPELYSSFVEFYCAMNGFEKGIKSFLCKLISCFICLNCFLCIAVNIFMSSFKFSFVSFLFSIVVYFLISKIQKNLLS